MASLKNVVLGKVENVNQTRYILTADFPVMDTKDGLRLFTLTMQTFRNDPYSWLCYPSMQTFHVKRRFSNDAEFIKAVEHILNDCLVEWDKEKQPELWTSQS